MTEMYYEQLPSGAISKAPNVSRTRLLKTSSMKHYSYIVFCLASWAAAPATRPITSLPSDIITAALSTKGRQYLQTEIGGGGTV